MTRTNEKPFFDEFAVYKASVDQAAREARAKAVAELIRKAASGIAGLVKRGILEPLRARAEKKRQLEDLMNMDDHMLRDLGLSRGGIVYAFEHGRENLDEPANTNTPLNKPRAA